jgi:hypothetical protein
MECNAMVVDHPSRIDGALEVSIPLALIEFELQSFPATTVYHIDI